ncbi:tyrosine-type recombinase/integrase [Streptomyces cynarae]|uniref:tyrosine-type recombinase/integrase n=1 Tax=Streptomyces cynarae TaxID=2981134 RepID=UPI00406C7699
MTDLPAHSAPRRPRTTPPGGGASTHRRRGRVAGKRPDLHHRCRRTLRPQRHRPAIHRTTRPAGTRRVRFHDLRHTCATLLLEQGVQLVTIKELLGHANIGITAQVYAHVRLRLQHDAINQLSDVLRDGDDPGSQTTATVAPD